MPYDNRFRHQNYTAERPAAPYRVLCAALPPPPASKAGQAIIGEAMQAWHTHQVAGLYLMHGTFAGADAFGFAGELARWLPTVAQQAREAMKGLVDLYLGDAGNYTEQFVVHLEGAANARNLRPPMAIRRLHWSSENLHIGRADGAIRLLDDVATRDWPAGSRVLVWAHSHAGNALALATNLLAAEDGAAEFFRRTRRYYRSASGALPGLEHWPRVAEHLARDDSPLRRVTLDIVTYGTPIRYGWDLAGCGRLLHVVHHRPVAELPEWRGPLPRNGDELTAACGDLVHLIGIAGTDFVPPLSAMHVWRTERGLRRFLEGDLRRRDLLARMACGQRVAVDGTTLLIDYGPGNEALAGHAVYTRERWLPFHAALAARWLYNEPPESDEAPYARDAAASG